MNKLDFGDYCKIEQKRYGVDNEVYIYKVVNRMKSNCFRPVPVDANEGNSLGDLCEVVSAIQCGVDETKVEKFRLKDVLPITQ